MKGEYTVIWRHYLIESLLAGFVVSAMEQGQDVNAISDAMAEIERRLAQDPQTEGESRANFERILICSPLAVDFEVHEEERIVQVLRLRYSPRRPKQD